MSASANRRHRPNLTEFVPIVTWEARVTSVSWNAMAASKRPAAPADVRAAPEPSNSITWPSLDHVQLRSLSGE